MAECTVKQLAEKQKSQIISLIRQVRVLVGPLQSIGSVVEEQIISFKPLYLVIKEMFQLLLEADCLERGEIAFIQEDLELLEEEIDEVEQSSIFRR